MGLSEHDYSGAAIVIGCTQTRARISPYAVSSGVGVTADALAIVHTLKRHFEQRDLLVFKETTEDAIV